MVELCVVEIEAKDFKCASRMGVCQQFLTFHCIVAHIGNVRESCCWLGTVPSMQMKTNMLMLTGEDQGSKRIFSLDALASSLYKGRKQNNGEKEHVVLFKQEGRAP